jgi:type III secretion protein K
MNTAVIEARPHGAGAVVVERGCRLLLAALAGEGEPIVRSAQRKLPRRVSQRALPVLQAAQRAELSELMLLCLVPERLPEWDWLF